MPESEIGFSKMSRTEQERLRRDAGSGLSRKVLDSEALQWRKKLDRAVAIDEKERRDLNRSFDNFNREFLAMYGSDSL